MKHDTRARRLQVDDPDVESQSQVAITLKKIALRKFRSTRSNRLILKVTRTYSYVKTPSAIFSEKSSRSNPGLVLEARRYSRPIRAQCWYSPDYYLFEEMTATAKRDKLRLSVGAMTKAELGSLGCALPHLARVRTHSPLLRVARVTWW